MKQEKIVKLLSEKGLLKSSLAKSLADEILEIINSETEETPTIYTTIVFTNENETFEMSMLVFYDEEGEYKDNEFILTINGETWDNYDYFEEAITDYKNNRENSPARSDLEDSVGFKTETIKALLEAHKKYQAWNTLLRMMKPTKPTTGQE